MSDPIQTFDIQVQDLTSNEMLVNALTQVAARIDGDIAQANALRASGDAVINAAMVLLDQRVTVLEQKPDELTEGEREVIEGFLDRLVKQEGFGSLIAGLSLNIGGANFSLKSIVESMLAARKIATIDPANYVLGIPRTIGVGFVGGESVALNAVETAKTAEDLSALFGRAVTNPGISLVYSGPFGAGVVGLSRVYEIVQREFAGVTVPEYRPLRRTAMVLSLPGFAASAPVVLGGLDETGDGVVGVPPLVSPLEAALAALDDAIAAKATADAAVIAAQATVNTATTANTDAQAAANLARPAAETAANDAQTAYTTAQGVTSTAATADQTAAADLAAAEQTLADANLTGDQVQIDAAQELVNTEQADRSAAAQALSNAQTAEATAAQAYTTAVQALNDINSTASGASQALATALSDLATKQAEAAAATTAKNDAQAAYDALV